MHRHTNSSTPGPDAVFIGWQESPFGGVFPLYNITKTDHPARGSTVSNKELREMHLRVPEFPRPDERAVEVEPEKIKTRHR